MRMSYAYNIAVVKHMLNMAIFRQLVMVAPLHVLICICSLSFYKTAFEYFLSSTWPTEDLGIDYILV